LFSVIVTKASTRPPGIGNHLFFRKNYRRRIPLMSAYVYQPVFSLAEAHQQQPAHELRRRIENAVRGAIRLWQSRRVEDSG
jgi:hypothetical protein